MQTFSNVFQGITKQTSWMSECLILSEFVVLCALCISRPFHDNALVSQAQLLPPLGCNFCHQRETGAPATSTDSLGSAGPGQWAWWRASSARRSPASWWRLSLLTPQSSLSLSILTGERWGLAGFYLSTSVAGTWLVTGWLRETESCNVATQPQSNISPPPHHTRTMYNVDCRATACPAL